ncbi:MAG: CopG family transcriptional regulator [Candidatus Rokuibacteriota bacterium]
MQKTTVYLPEDLKRALEEAARSRGESVAELIREALRALVATTKPPRPRIPLFRSDDPTLAERADEALHGFGER